MKISSSCLLVLSHMLQHRWCKDERHQVSHVTSLSGWWSQEHFLVIARLILVAVLALSRQLCVHLCQRFKTHPTYNQTPWPACNSFADTAWTGERRFKRTCFWLYVVDTLEIFQWRMIALPGIIRPFWDMLGTSFKLLVSNLELGLQACTVSFIVDLTHDIRCIWARLP